MDYYSKANAQIIEDLKDLPIKKQYLEGDGEIPPLTNVMSHDLNDSKFFADYISILRDKYPDADLNITQGKTELCYRAARAGQPEIWIEACHKNNVTSNDYPRFFIQFNCSGAYKASLYMLINSEYFQLSADHIAKAFYYLIAELDDAFDEDDQPIELINCFLNKLEGKVNFDIEELTGVKDDEYSYLFFLCLGIKPFSVPLFINKWISKEILEDRSSWDHFSDYYYDRHENYNLPVMVALKTSGIQFDDTIMLEVLEEYNLTKLIKAYKNASEQC